jgi:hypothetical protein
MNVLSRRTLLSAMSVGAVALLQGPRRALAAAQCVTGAYPAFLPNALTVDCASRRNYALFRQNEQYLGLAGAVSMSAVRGKFGSYEAGNLFLFPWLKPKGAALGAAKQWGCVFPTNATAVHAAGPIPNAALPLDEYFCRFVLQVPTTATFIGFSADAPFSDLEVKLGLYSNAKLADGQRVGIDWASSNLNHPWFGGDRQIPASDACNGKAWRQLIANGLDLASRQAC